MQLSNFLGFYLCVLDDVLRINFYMQHSRAKLEHCFVAGRPQCIANISLINSIEKLILKTLSSVPVAFQ